MIRNNHQNAIRERIGRTESCSIKKTKQIVENTENKKNMSTTI